MGTSQVYPCVAKYEGSRSSSPGEGAGLSVTHPWTSGQVSVDDIHLLSPGSVLVLLASSSKATPSPSSVKTLLICGVVTTTPTSDSHRGHPSLSPTSSAMSGTWQLLRADGPLPSPLPNDRVSCPLRTPRPTPTRISSIVPPGERPAASHEPHLTPQSPFSGHAGP